MNRSTQNPNTKTNEESLKPTGQKTSMASRILGSLLLPISSPSPSSSPPPPAAAVSRTSSQLAFPYRLLFPPPPPASPSSLPLDDPDSSFILKNSTKNQKLLKELTTFGIGGPCRYFLEASAPCHLSSAVKFCNAESVPLIVVGKGSNCLFSDSGFDGMVVLNRMAQGLVEVVEPGTYRVGSGYPFNRLGVRCSAEGYGGLEFAGGIPGTVGGATFMNAGANGQETGDVVQSVEMMTREGEIRVMERPEMEFGYRWSSFQEMDDLAAILAVTFKLTPAAEARERQRAYLERRRKTQPISERSAGSVFRNPIGQGITAGELIDLAGLKGFQIGGAKVSEVHANFFVNSDGSSSKDMLELINFVKERVHHLFGVQLKEEIRYVPYNFM